MKRSPALLSLSRDHHQALSLANRIARAEDETAIAELMAAVPERFRTDIEPHFVLEEEGLLASLSATDDLALVQRTLDEHRSLRDLAARIREGDENALKRFGIELRDHVRFEERELFVHAEKRMGVAS
jgi:hypothetical protein